MEGGNKEEAFGLSQLMERNSLQLQTSLFYFLKLSCGFSRTSNSPSYFPLLIALSPGEKRHSPAHCASLVNHSCHHSVPLREEVHKHQICLFRSPQGIRGQPSHPEMGKSVCLQKEVPARIHMNCGSPRCLLPHAIHFPTVTIWSGEFSPAVVDSSFHLCLGPISLWQDEDCVSSPPEDKWSGVVGTSLAQLFVQGAFLLVAWGIPILKILKSLFMEVNKSKSLLSPTQHLALGVHFLLYVGRAFLSFAAEAWKVKHFV